jgi:hypothetical protein
MINVAAGYVLHTAQQEEIKILTLKLLSKAARMPGTLGKNYNRMSFRAIGSGSR